MMNLAASLRDRAVIADGATGSLLDAMLGDEMADRRELVAIERPDTASKVHRAYIEAGAEILKTATFNANARSLRRFYSPELPVPGLAGDPAALARRINEASAALARSAVDAAFAADGRQRWVAGSVGPGSDAPSLGGCSYGELRDSYLPQMLGLIAGGADLVLIETVQDPLQAKAAIGALAEAGRSAARALPFIVSATVDSRGRMLSGAGVRAFAAIMEAFGPLAIGLNCSGGPDELASAFGTLAEASSAPVCIMPNAGLPRSVGGKVTWPLDAAGFAERTGAIARRFGAGIVGGCCGTGPGHIAALVAAMAGAPKPALRPRRIFALASAFDAVGGSGKAGLFVIDERSNAAGSVAFKSIVKSGDFEAAARFVVDRAARGADAVDISVAGSARDERAAMVDIVSRASPVSAAAISIDSTDPEVIAAVLPLIGGRPLVNSVNLEDTEKASRLFDLARDHGAAVICLAMDAHGPARDSATKLAICRNLYDLALSRGLAPEDLLFDAATFPVASGDKSLATSAVETLTAVRGLAGTCPGSLSVLGVGNSSFGLPKSQRPAFTSRFVVAAKAAGLGAAIVDPATLELSLPEPLADAADALVEARGGQEGYGEAIERLLSLGQAGSSPEAAAGSIPAQQGEAGPLEELAAAVISGDSKRAVGAVLAASATLASTAVAQAIAGAMAELGRRYDAGAIALPLVLRSADAARDAFSSLRASSPRGGPGATGRSGATVLLSTVRGDLHDIGKNLVGMVLEAAGFEIHDLGTDKSADDIAAAAMETGAVAVGVSGLLTRSLAEMEKVARALADAGSKALLLCGGAAVDREYVSERIEPLRPGLVAYGKDPFEAVSLLEHPRPVQKPAPMPDSQTSALPLATPPGSRGNGLSRATDAPNGLKRRVSLVEGPAFTPPFIGSDAMDTIPFEDLVAALDEGAVVRSRWGYSDAVEGGKALADAVSSLRVSGGLAAECRYGYFRARKRGDDIVELSTASSRCFAFRFPRESGGERRSVADFYADDDMAAAFCVTLGRQATAYLATVREIRDSSAYLRAHGLLAGLAEAAAEMAHRRLALWLSLRGAASAGKRYSFGFPGCPGVECNADLLELLSAGEIGLRTTSGHQLDPEFSVTAVLVPRAAARYIDA